MIKLSKRLVQAMEIRGVKQAELSQETGIGKSSISTYISGQYEPKQRNIYKIAKVLDISEAWLMGYDVPMERDEKSDYAPIPPGFIPPPRMVKVPLVGSIACGTPIEALENLEGYVDVPDNIRCDFALRCQGDSMVDAKIQDGDVVYIRKQPDVENGEIAAVRIGNEATLKRVYKSNNRLTLAPANPIYEPHIYIDEELNDITIEGKAVGFTHWFG